jgi:hypothetical protein
MTHEETIWKIVKEAANLEVTVEKLAAALRDAENAAYERAAHVALNIWMDAHDTDFDVGVNTAKRTIATAIRPLKGE